MKQFDGKVAVVTGASSGIGRAMASGLAREGATLVLVARDAGRLQLVSDEVLGLGGVAFSQVADLRDESQLLALTAFIKSELGRTDVLVHNAALHVYGRLGSESPGLFDEVLRINLLAPYILTRELLPHLLRDQGQIVFMNSSAAHEGRAGVGIFCASKAALKALSESIRNELNSSGVRVLSVYPGRTATPTQERLHTLEGRDYRPDLLLQPEDVASVVVHSLCLPRTAEVTDIRIRPMRKPLC